MECFKFERSFIQIAGCTHRNSIKRIETCMSHSLRILSSPRLNFTQFLGCQWYQPRCKDTTWRKKSCYKTDLRMSIWTLSLLLSICCWSHQHLNTDGVVYGHETSEFTRRDTFWPRSRVKIRRHDDKNL